MTVVSVLLGVAAEVSVGSIPHHRQVKVHLYFSIIYIYKSDHSAHRRKVSRDMVVMTKASICLM